MIYLLTLAVIVLAWFVFDTRKELNKLKNEGSFDDLPLPPIGFDVVEEDEPFEEFIPSEEADTSPESKIIQRYPIDHAITKSFAINEVNKLKGYGMLSNVNTSYANRSSAAPIWWFDIAPAKFKYDVHFILVKSKGFYWITLPKGTAPEPAKKFKIRDDNGLVDIKISSEKGVYYLKDTLGGGTEFGFEKYIVKEFKYSLQ